MDDEAVVGKGELTAIGESRAVFADAGDASDRRGQGRGDAAADLVDSGACRECGFVDGDEALRGEAGVALGDGLHRQVGGAAGDLVEQAGVPGDVRVGCLRGDATAGGVGVGEENLAVILGAFAATDVDQLDAKLMAAAKLAVEAEGVA